MTNIRLINSPQAEYGSVVLTSSTVAQPFIPRPTVTTSEVRALRTLSKPVDTKTMVNNSSSDTVGHRPGQEPEENDDDDSEDGDNNLLSVHRHQVHQDLSGEDSSSQHSMSLSDTAFVMAEFSTTVSDMALTDELAHMTDNGIFEVQLPGGESLGVAVDIRASGVGFLLSPSSDKLRQRLQKQHMELEGTLKQRMGRSVNIAIL
ncbi:hypothetical protein ACO0LB_14620 [Undibacterium sp. SXout7W]|uniref:hypothetical protein n=1 Tax=Undibacterium sp. SXout7W TaxID=3413049 RepID=UPI003BEF7B23